MKLNIFSFTALAFAASCAHAQFDNMPSIPGAPDKIDFVPISNALTGLDLPALPIGAIPTNAMVGVKLDGLSLPPPPNPAAASLTLPELPSEPPAPPSNLPIADVPNLIGNFAP